MIVEVMPHARRALAGQSAELSIGVYSDGQAVDVSGTLTFTAYGPFGDVVATGTPSKSGHVLTAVLDDDEAADVTTLRIVWAGLVVNAAAPATFRSDHELVGSFLFTIAEARAYAPAGTRKFDDRNLWPDDRLMRYRDVVTDGFAQVLGWSPGRRYGYETFDGGDRGLPLKARKVTAVRAVRTRLTAWETLDDDAIDLPSLRVTSWGLVDLPGIVDYGLRPWYDATEVGIAYEHGVEPIPLELGDAALALVHEKATPSDITGRALSVTNELGNITISTPGRGYPDAIAFYGVPDVDAVLNRLRERPAPGIA